MGLLFGLRVEPTSALNESNFAGITPLMDKVELPIKWVEWLREQPETGMGYQIVSLRTQDGHTYDRVAIVDGSVVEIKGNANCRYLMAESTRLIRGTASELKCEFTRRRVTFHTQRLPPYSS
jgi:hypothetical protein